MHQSVATIDSPEFLNLQPLDINPLMSKCQIKVLYIGANRNHSFISEEVAAEISKTLRGAPIVGYYRDSKEDFTDHGEKVIIDDEGIKFECQTIPYGFVSPDAKVWFQNFEDIDQFGNSVVHKYLMTTGYLWTSQFPESSLPVNEGRPQSMQLQQESLKGHWSTDPSNGLDFFIINDAIIQKICILGEDVQPCFQGASIDSPKVSNSFSLDDNFKHTLFSMMQDLRKVLNRGGQQMENLENIKEEELKDVETEFEKIQDKVDENVSPEFKKDIEDVTASSDYVKQDKDDDKEEEQEKEEEKASEETQDSSEQKDNKEDDDDEKKKKYQLLQEKFTELENSYSLLKEQYQSLVAFKTQIDNQKKDELIAEFYMLSEDDKKDVLQNKEKYTLDEIKAKLSVICFDKKINFSTEEKVEPEKEVFTYNMVEEADTLPDWVKLVKEQERMN